MSDFNLGKNYFTSEGLKGYNRKTVYDYCLKDKEAVAVEVGVREGRNAKHLFSYDPKHLYLVDPWEPYRQIPSEREHERSYEMVREYFYDNDLVTVIRNKSTEASQLFPDNSLDFVYIDGDHQYEPVKADLEAWIQKIKVGQFLAGDDYHKGPDNQNWGVIEAVDEFIDDHDVEIVYFDELKTFPLSAQTSADWCLRRLS